MRVGLLSDTHIPEVAKGLPPELMEAFQGVVLILHAGDIYIPSVLDDLEHIAPVLAARGDDDYGDTLKDERVKEKHILKLEGQILWLTHERPSLHMIASQQQENGAPDIVVFGHEHNTFVQHYDGVLFVNPGSPTFLNYLSGLGTVSILNIDSDGADALIIRL